MLLPRPLANAIIAVVTLVWAINFGAQFVPGLDYKPDVSINGIFLALVGGSIALSRKGAKKPGEEDDDEEGGPDLETPYPPPTPLPRARPRRDPYDDGPTDIHDQPPRRRAEPDRTTPRRDPPRPGHRQPPRHRSDTEASTWVPPSTSPELAEPASGEARCSARPLVLSC